MAPKARSRSSCRRCAFFEVHGHWAVPPGFAILTARSSKTKKTERATPGKEADASDLRHLRLDALLSRFFKAARSDPEAFAAAIKELERIGFPAQHLLDHSDEGKELSLLRWNEVTMRALETYKELHGDVWVPSAFVVPSGDEWPRALWGLRLGKTVRNLRATRRTLQAYKLEALDRIGFVLDTKRVRWDEFVMPALRRFMELHGHCRVPREFVVPAPDSQRQEGEWPASLAGYRLGNRVNGLRNGQWHADVRAEEFRELGFVWSVDNDRWNNAILPAFQHFYLLYGHSYIPCKFVVPHVD